MAHKYYSEYTFIVGSDWHDSVIKVESYTKAMATKLAMDYKVRSTDHCRFVESKVLLKWDNKKDLWVSV